MVSLGGQPYIDVRLSLNSFLPRDLSPEIGEKLIEKWISMLIERPNLHDKIEFDVATTSYRFDMDSHLDATIGDLLTAEERRALSNSLALCDQSWPGLKAAWLQAGWKEVALRLEHCGTTRVRIER